MSAKPDAKEAKEAAPAADKNAAPAAPKGGGLKAFIPAVAAVVVAPAACWAVAQFVLLPQLQKKLAVSAAPAGEHAEGEHAAEPAAEEKKGGEGHGGGGHGGKEAGKEGNANGYEFSNVVVNLAGTMGTRYLKTTFLVTGTSNSMKATFEAKKPQLTDVTLNVLSSLTLAELEEPGAKNVLREKLVAAYNQALGKRVADQVYFSDFVIQ